MDGRSNKWTDRHVRHYIGFWPENHNQLNLAINKLFRTLSLQSVYFQNFFFIVLIAYFVIVDMFVLLLWHISKQIQLFFYCSSFLVRFYNICQEFANRRVGKKFRKFLFSPKTISKHLQNFWASCVYRFVLRKILTKVNRKG